MSQVRIFFASLAATAATILIPLFTSLSIRPGLHPDGTPDNAPYRAAGIIIIFMPYIALILFVTWYFLTWLLVRLNKMSKFALFIYCLLASLLIGCLFAAMGHAKFGMDDALWSLLVFAGVTFVCSGLGASAWWLVAFT